VPRFLLETWSSFEGDKADCDFGYVDLTREYARELLARYEIFLSAKEKDEGVSSLSFWDRSVRYFRSADEVVGRFGEWEDRIALPEDFVLPEDLEQNTRYDRVVAIDGKMFWEATPKHTNITIEARGIPVEEIRKIAEEGE